MLTLRDNLFQLDAKMLESIISVKLISFSRDFCAQHIFICDAPLMHPIVTEPISQTKNAFGQIDSYRVFFCLFFVSSAKSQRQTDG